MQLLIRPPVDFRISIYNNAVPDKNGLDHGQDS